MLREAERAAKLDKEMTSNNNKYIRTVLYLVVESILLLNAEPGLQLGAPVG